MGKYVKLSIDYESLLLCSVQISKYHPPTAISQAWCWVWDFFYFFYLFFWSAFVLCSLSSWDGTILLSASYLAEAGWAFPQRSVG